jgi:hypothetical protein
MRIRHYDPTGGQAFQGDVVIMPVPPGIDIAEIDEMAPTEGRLVLQEGEVSGHHHAIRMPAARQFRSTAGIVGDPVIAPSRPPHRRALGGGGSPRPGRARLFRDTAFAHEMVSRGLLTRADLAIGCLVVEDGMVVVSHEEHDGIALPPGRYYVGRQVESAGAEERVVAD